MVYLDRFVLKYAGPEVYVLQMRLALGHFYTRFHTRDLYKHSDWQKRESRRVSNMVSFAPLAWNV